MGVAMKWLFCALMMCLLGLSATASQVQKPYGEMTYLELQSVDPASLSKKERKQFKKAFKAAKKAHKKELKAQEAAQKNLSDMNAAVELSVRQAKVEFNEQANTKTVSSWEMGAKDFMALGARGWIKYFIVADKNDTSSDQSARIVIKTMASEAVDDAETLMPAPPRNSGRSRRLQWHGYDLQYHRRDAVMTLAKENADKGLGQAYSGLIEEVVIPINHEDLLKPVRVGSGIAISLDSKLSTSVELDLPSGFLVGYLLKLSQEGFLTGEESEFIGKLADAIKRQSGK